MPLSASSIHCAHLIRETDAKLLQLLASLRPDEWELQTVAPAWKVRDVAAHLLDTALRKLSLARDHWIVEPTVIRSGEDLAVLVNRLNQEGVTVYRRLSPATLIAMMAVACRELADFDESLDPFSPAAFAVSWAGEEQSLNWFDTARELTERWHHQQQIRLATGRPGLMVPELYHPVLDCFLRGLPHAYRDLEAARGAMVQVAISGNCGGVWQIRKETKKTARTPWVLVMPGDQWDSRVVVPQEIAWRLFTRGCSREEAAAKVAVEGDYALGRRVLELAAIV